VHAHPPFPDDNAFSVGKESPFPATAMRPTVNVPEKDRATNIGNMHKKLVKIARVVPGISSRTDRQRHRHTARQTHREIYSSQYFATQSAKFVQQ